MPASRGDNSPPLRPLLGRRPGARGIGRRPLLTLGSLGSAGTALAEGALDPHGSDRSGGKGVSLVLPGGVGFENPLGFEITAL